MSTSTPYLALLKPAGSEFVDEVLHLNNNYDKVDTFAADTDSRLDALEVASTVLIALKSADETKSNGPANDADLTLPVAANSVYEVNLNVYYFTGGEAGFSNQIVVPAGASYRGLISVGTYDPANFVVLAVTELSATIVFGNPGSANGMAVRYTGMITTGGSAGNVTFKWGRSAGAMSAFTLVKNSLIKLTKVA